MSQATLNKSSILITCSDSYREGRRTEKYQISLWNSTLSERILQISGPTGYPAEWAGIISLGEKEILVVYYNTVIQLYSIDKGEVLASETNIFAIFFGCFNSDISSFILSGDFGSFAIVKIEKVNFEKDNIQYSVVHSLDVPIHGGWWGGPIKIQDRQCVLSAQNDIRIWDLDDFINKAGKAKKIEVGQINEDGEHLFTISSSKRGQYFCGISKLGNLRIWDYNGQLVHLDQLVTSLDNLSGALEYIHMIDFGEDTLYVGSTRNGIIRIYSIRELRKNKIPVRNSISLRIQDLIGTLLNRKSLNSRQALSFKKLSGYISAFIVDYLDGIPFAFVGLEDSDRESSIQIINLISGEELDLSHPHHRFPGGWKWLFQIRGYEDKSITRIAVAHLERFNLLVGSCSSPYFKIQAWNLTDKTEVWRDDSMMYNEITNLISVKLQGEDLIAATGKDGKLIFWNALNGEKIKSFYAHPGMITGLCSLHKGGKDVLISASKFGRIAAWSSGYERILEIDIGESINGITALVEQRIAIATESGYVLLELPIGN